MQSFMKMKSKINLKKISDSATKLIVEMAYRSQSGETGSSLCIADILITLYFKLLKIDPKNPEAKDRDRFVLSKGHGAAALYAILHLRGFFKKEKLSGYRVNGGELHAHPSLGAVPGIEVSTGSLGHGLAIGAGIALSLREESPKSTVYVLMGDGECNEGSVWESAMVIKALGLKNIIVIIDNNGFQGFGETKKTNKVSLKKEWRGFGWKVFECDGHSHGQLEEKISLAKKQREPAVVIANTIAGKGVAKIERTLKAHYFVPNEEDYKLSQG